MRIDFIWFRNKSRGNDNTEELLPPMTDEQEGPFAVTDAQTVLDHDPITSDHFGVLAVLALN
ncbi:hypothetical protein MHBO_004553 [Bonamia ostreae]|uniref:Uncharacterized protein n=1 Tax=Bonamia ostreae TaxID=126728 RepID=A0ABV2ATS6_9EUKA